MRRHRLGRRKSGNRQHARGLGTTRHSGQQCRHHPGYADPSDERRGLGQRDRDQLEIGLSVHPDRFHALKETIERTIQVRVWVKNLFPILIDFGTPIDN